VTLEAKKEKKEKEKEKEPNENKENRPAMSLVGCIPRAY